MSLGIHAGVSATSYAQKGIIGSVKLNKQDITIGYMTNKFYYNCPLLFYLSTSMQVVVLLNYGKLDQAVNQWILVTMAVRQAFVCVGIGASNLLLLVS